MLAAFAALLTVVGVPVGIMWRQHVKTVDEDRAALVAAHEREIANLREAHEREIADRDRRLEASSVTETRLIEMAFRSVMAGEKAADTAVTALRNKAS